MSNAYAIERTCDVWTDWHERFSLGVCGCGVASGASYPTIEGAQREPLHVCRNTRTRPVWNGQIVDVAPFAINGEVVR